MEHSDLLAGHESACSPNWVFLLTFCCNAGGPKFRPSITQKISIIWEGATQKPIIFFKLKGNSKERKVPLFSRCDVSSGGKFGLKNGTKIAKITYLGVPHSPRKFSLLLIVTYVFNNNDAYTHSANFSNNDAYPQCKFQVFRVDFGQVRN